MGARTLMSGWARSPFNASLQIMSLWRIIVNMTFNVIISALTTGFIWWLVGIEENKKTAKLFGAFMVLVSIVLNMISQFNGG